MKLQLPKGMRDFSPEEKILRDNIQKKLIKIFEIYGFNPLETPIVERLDILSAKFVAGSSSDIMKEIFKLKDQGKRDLGLRFDLTVPLARYVAMNPNLKLPFKRYQIGEVFRDGPIKLGRYREFWQCDVDTIGTSNMIADAELIKLALDVFSELKIDAYIKVNNRQLLISLLKYAGVKEKNIEKAVITIDKLDKIGEEGVKEELKEFLETSTVNKIIEIFNLEGTPKQVLEKLQQLNLDDAGTQAIQDLKEVFSYFNKTQLNNIELSLSLARGFNYYTGTIFEGYQRSAQVTSSICGGGRYDNLVGNYSETQKTMPAVGISFGLDVIAELFKLEDPDLQKTKVKVYIIPIKTQKASMKIADKLRKAQIKTDIDLIGRSISKNLDFVDKLSIPYALIIGEKELKKNKFTLRNMKTGSEKLLDIEQIIKKLK